MNAFAHHKRGSMTERRVAEVFARFNGRCQGPCGRKLRPGDDYHIDHVIALENGGTDADTNLQLICEWCHVEKTSDDHSKAAKGKRIYTKHVVPRRFKQKRGWR